jgi:urease accessory protein
MKYVPLILKKGRIIAINLTLASWTSPLFPIGGFAYSHGLEAAQEQGVVNSSKSLLSWLLGLLFEGSLKSDFALLKKSFSGEDVNALALALAPSQERLLETTQQGASFAKMINKAWGGNLSETLALPVAFGQAAKAKDFTLQDTLQAYGLNFLQNQISAALRLGIIGQTQGQELLHSLLTPLEQAVEKALLAQLEESGTAFFMADFLSAKHETQYTRIFRS